MSTITTLSINLEPELLQHLDKAAVVAGVTREQMAVQAIEQQLDVALRHLVLLSRMEEMDAHIVALAEFIGEVSAPPDPEQVKSFCRYRPERTESET